MKTMRSVTITDQTDLSQNLKSLLYVSIYSSWYNLLYSGTQIKDEPLTPIKQLAQSHQYFNHLEYQIDCKDQVYCLTISVDIQ